jgi:hypothetical protein
MKRVVWRIGAGWVAGLALFLHVGCDKQTSSKAPSPPPAAPSALPPSPTKAPDAPPATDATAADGQPMAPRAEALKGAWWELVEGSHDFGSAWAGQFKSHVFVLKNTGPETLEIYEMKPSCGCVSTERLPRRIAPGKAANIPFHADLSGRLGPFLESITLITNDAQRTHVVMEMTGQVRMPATQEVIYDSSLPGGGDAASLAPIRKMLASFGQVKPDRPLKRIVRIQNTSGQPLQLEVMSVHPEGSPFSATLRETQPGETFELTVEGKPPFKEGLTKATIAVRTNIPDYDRFTITASAEVIGRIQVTPRKIVVNPDRRVVLERRITIRHDGTQPFEITGLFSSDASFDLRLLPADSTQPNECRAVLVLPGPDYRPPMWGEIIRFETTDAQRPTIDIPVVPDQDLEPAPRPENVPLVFQPGVMPNR